MKAWELLEKPESWTQGTLARGSDGLPTYPSSSGACCWCVFGALCVIYPGDDDFDAAESKIRKALDREFIGTWNDSTTHEEVIRVLKEVDV